MTLREKKQYYMDKIKELYKEDIHLRYPINAYEALTTYHNRKTESFFVITLDPGHNIIKIHEIGKGITNKCLAHPREIFFTAIKDQATAIIIAHNHPSNSLHPSSEDKQVTERIKKASDLIGIPLLDHIIFAKKGYMSFVEESLF